MGELKYCFEYKYVEGVLKNMKPKGLAVIDSEGIPSSTIRRALDRGVFIYDYLNAGALEKERPFYSTFKDLRIAPYDGWPGEYWVDPTADKWKQHLIDEARAKKKLGVHGLYFDNPDIYYMAGHGFGGTAMRKAPSKEAVYKALASVIDTIQNDVGLIVMPNGGEDFVKRYMQANPGRIKTINQEGVLYEDFKKQSSSERKYRTEWVDWAKKHGAYIRGIEYCKKASEKTACRAYYLLHGWQGLYISTHKDLRGD